MNLLGSIPRSSAAQRILRNVQERAAGLREISNSAAGLERDAASTLQGIEVVRNNASQLAETTDELKRAVGRFKL